MSWILLLAAVATLVYTVRRCLSARRNGAVAFFHPYCNAGGGGERVLWRGVQVIQKKLHRQMRRIVIYTGDVDATPEQILFKVRKRFGIELRPSNIDFVYLKWRRLLEADLYPHFTLLFQSLAGFIVALEALFKSTPDIMIDTTGYAASMLAFSLLGGCRVGAYVHYPMISTDMIGLVERREQSYNNSSVIVESGLLSMAKLYYYRALVFGYWIMGKTAKLVMVNGSWTNNHITAIWKHSNTRIVYPPCDVESFLAVERTAEATLSSSGILKIISIGQIRPEKNHRLQLEVLADVKEWCASKDNDGFASGVQLAIAGGCRNADDEKRVDELKKYAKELGVEKNMRWLLNVEYEDMLKELGDSMIAIHTMFNEHFGISVVEQLASGAITVAHDSGGPRLDIVLPQDGQPSGFLAVSREDFTHAIVNIVTMSPVERDAIRASARCAVARFSEAEFDEHWYKAMSFLVGDGEQK